MKIVFLMYFLMQVFFKGIVHSMILFSGPQGYDPEGYNLHRALVQKSSLGSRPRPEDLEPRRMADSFDHTLIPLGSDLKMRDSYITHMGSIRSVNRHKCI